MERKKELKQLYKETPIEAGILQIKNKKNGKLFIRSMRNIKMINGEKFTLEHNTHINKALQEDWNTFGKDAFEFEVVEILKKETDGYFNEKKALEQLEEKWLEQLQPYGERGYNKEKSR